MSWHSGTEIYDCGNSDTEVLHRSGLCPGTALGFFWILGAAAEVRELFRFSVDIARLGLRIAAIHGSSFERSCVKFIGTALIANDVLQSGRNILLRHGMHMSNRLNVALLTFLQVSGLSEGQEGHDGTDADSKDMTTSISAQMLLAPSRLLNSLKHQEIGSCTFG